MKLSAKLFILCFAMMIAVNAFSQKIELGVAGGLNLSKLNSNLPGFNADMRTGYHAGAGVKFSFTDKFGLTVHVFYSTKGAKSSIKDSFSWGAYTSTYTDETTIDAAFIELPVLARYTTAKGIYLNGGFYVAFLSSFKFENTITQVTPGQPTQVKTYSTTDHSDYSTTDAGIKLGIGFSIAGGLDIAVNYSAGLINFVKTNDIVTPYGSFTGLPSYYIHHGVISAGIGYWF